MTKRFDVNAKNIIFYFLWDIKVEENAAELLPHLEMLRGTLCCIIECLGALLWWSISPRVK
jgi:hypothetical protein